MERAEETTKAPRRWLTIAALIVAGESAFLLPFILARVFRPTLLDVFDLSNLQLGTAFSVYGLIAMAAYFFGGPLADRFPARAMLIVALISTAVGGLVMATVPPITVLVPLYGYWGITTIALFWAPLIRATREWGRDSFQGRAFGLLDGGRGLLAAVWGSIAVAVFTALLPEDYGTASLAQRAEALRWVILLASAVTCGAALLVWLALPKNDFKSNTRAGVAGPSKTPHLSLEGVRRVLAMPAVWLQGAIILCAYTGFKATDDFSLYAHEVVGLDDVDAAKAGTVSLWVRPVAAIGAGYLADRFGAPAMTILCFALLAAGSVTLASGVIGAGMIWIFLFTIVCSSMGIFALRGLYFAIMREGKVPMAYTGSAVGFVSLIGFMPDVFMGPLMGYLIDRSPGVTGHLHVFWVVSGFALLGLLASYAFSRVATPTGSDRGQPATRSS